MAKVLITSEYFGKFCDNAKKMLTDAGHLVIDNPYGHKFLTEEEIISHCGDADAFICDLEKITKRVIDSAPKLRIIARRGVGTDSVDVAYANSKSITVARALNIVEKPVSELVLAYILHFSRKVCELSKKMHGGVWERGECHSVSGKTLGLVGMGKIACETAKRASAFGMKIIYFSRSENKKAQELYGAERKQTLSELLCESDFVSIHTPLTDETKGLISYEELSTMKQTACLINTARGAIVDENALYRALSEKKIAYAAVDVFDNEPNTTSILKGLDNVLLTPHVGSFTSETFIKMDEASAQNIIDYFKGELKQ